ncbi:hypothetical protein RRG08_025028 [Elysia crispata]|uniref:DDE-1 domain-containing protein n=1 Tax=Elysia crispata TaxID=231223 RepID=A0AAE1E1S3_9GAST|nr:hypothetical protein RRG08_025028 [Elysia crispata]
MDSSSFEEWFLSIIVAWGQRLKGKIIIGDNLRYHLSVSVIEKCPELDIGFVLLPPNSIDKCQPLDVALFGPVKREWKKTNESYKLKYPSSTSLDKSTFPRLLTQLMTALRMRSSQNIISGFKACGIHLLNRDAVLKKFPSSSLSASGAESDANSHVSSAVIEYLQQFNYSPGGNKFSHRCSRKKISLEPGKSILNLVSHQLSFQLW